MGSLTDDLLSLITTLAYPASVENPLSDMEPEISTLSDLAAVEIVSRIELLRSTHEQKLLPLPLYHTLLRACLLWGHDQSLRYLMENWPFLCIRLCDVVKLPLLRSPLSIVYYEMALAKLKIGVRLTTAMIRTLLDCIGELKPEKTRLQFLDLSGFPTAEVVTCYAAVQCQLVNTDVQRQEMIRNFNQLLSLVNTSENTEEDDADDCEGLATYHPYEEAGNERFSLACALYFDLTLSHGDRVEEIMNALVWSKTPACRFRLVCSALNLQGLGFDVVARILECTIKSELRSLDIAHNSMGRQLLALMTSLNSTFSSLHSLDLSANGCNLSSLHNRDESAGFMGSAIGNLPALKHLSLSRNRLSCSLAAILGPLAGQLDTLRLSECALQESDMRYLASSQHGQFYLDISANNLGEPKIWRHFIELLRRRGTSLLSLDISRTFISDDELVEIVKEGGASTWLKRLRYLNLSRNIIVTRFLRVIIEQFVFEAPRCVLHLPCPFNCREREDGTGNVEDGSNIKHDLAAHGDLKLLASENIRVVFSGQAF